ncbi:MAG: glycosyltransferase family 39 protein [Endozoicomonas sp. (ex Botrylloides leachii)]|nr:glycosyltransferase family 39 protein [Endozoicomonas sp. (ex Botrylloides leachii)]
MRNWAMATENILTDIKQLQTRPWFWLVVLCLFQLIFWTLSETWVRHSPHADTLEGIAWGNLWQWGYSKHPPLAAWLTALFASFSDSSDLPIYLLAQLSIVTVFIAVWRLAKEYLSDYSAVLAVFLLLGVLFYSNRVERVTPDTIQGPIWALLVLTFYFAVTRVSLTYWLLSGLFSGLALLAKYQAAVLLLPLMLTMLTTTAGKQNLKTWYPWLGALVAIAVIAPHLLWLTKEHFAPVEYFETTYVHSSTGIAPPRWFAHLFHPLEFAVNSFSNVIPLLLLCIPLFRGKKQHEQPQGVLRGSFQQQFLIAVALGPFILTLMLGLFTGKQLIPRWATPYFAWLPLLILVYVKPVITYQRFRTLAICCLALGITFCGLRTAYLYYKPMYKADYWYSDEYLPAREEMAYTQKLWHQYSHEPMPYLAGLHYHIAALVAYDRTGIIPYFDLDPSQSLWLKPEDIRRKGGMILIRQGKRQTAMVQQRLEQNYPDAIYLGRHSFQPVGRLDQPVPVSFTTDFYLLMPQEKIPDSPIASDQ